MVFFKEIKYYKKTFISYIAIDAEPSSTDDANVNGGTKALPNNYTKVISDTFYRIFLY